MPLLPLDRLLQLQPFAFLIDRTKSLRSMLSSLLAIVGKPAVFPFLVLILLGFSRLPVTRFDGELDADQSLFMAQAMRYEHDLVPWRSVDTTTSGPLNSWAFYVMRLAFGNPSYATIHAMSAVVMSMTILLTWLSLRRLCSSQTAALGALCACAYFMLSQGHAVTHFTSELVPLSLIAAGIWMLAIGLESPPSRKWSWPVAALFLGAAPWAKLQAAPISAVLGMGLLGMTWWLRPRGEKFFTSTLLRLILTAGAFSFATLFFIALTYSQGALEDLWVSYIQRNLSYSEMRWPGTQFTRFMDMWKDTARVSVISLLVVGLCAFTLVWAGAGCPGWRNQTRDRKALLWLMVFHLAAGIYAMTKPPFNFPHYHFFVVLPAVFIATMLLEFWSTHPATERAQAPVSRRFNPAYTCFFFMILVLQFAAIKSSAGGWLDRWHRKADSPNVHAAQRINVLAPEAKSLGVWGWAPELNVRTGLTPATRHGICHYVIEANPLREHFRKTYLEDLQRERPGVFVDAVTPHAFLWWGWKGDERIESFPALHEFITSNYRLAENYPPDDTKTPYRIYLLNGNATER